MIDGAVVAVVVPAHNEERWIEEVLDTMPDFVDHVFVVDDASEDRTAAIASAWAAGGCGSASSAPDAARREGSRPQVTVLRNSSNRGVGAGITRGYREACARGARVIVVMAGDGQMDPSDLQRLLGPVLRGEADYVKGDRFAHPDVWQAMPRARLAGGWVLSVLTSSAAGVRVHDSQCGYTAVAASALEALDLAAIWPRYGYPNDLIGAFAIAGKRIGHVTVRPVYRGEHSGLRPWHLATISFVIARVAWRRFWRSCTARPLALAQRKR